METRLIACEGGIPRRPRVLTEREGEPPPRRSGVHENVVAQAPALRAQRDSGGAPRAAGNGREAGEGGEGREEVEELHRVLGGNSIGFLGPEIGPNFSPKTGWNAVGKDTCTMDYQFIRD